MSSESDTESDARKNGRSKASALFGKVLGALIFAAVVWFLLGGRISYAASECSKGVKQCAVGIAVALGVVDVYDKNDHCIGSGCNF